MFKENDSKRVAPAPFIQPNLQAPREPHQVPQFAGTWKDTELGTVGLYDAGMNSKKSRPALSRSHSQTHVWSARLWG